jgi:hypothetical protein
VTDRGEEQVVTALAEERPTDRAHGLVVTQVAADERITGWGDSTKGSRKGWRRGSIPHEMRGSTSASAGNYSRRVAKRRPIGSSFRGLRDPERLCSKRLGSAQARATVEYGR